MATITFTVTAAQATRIAHALVNHLKTLVARGEQRERELAAQAAQSAPIDLSGA